eukprot:TRINITY_DN7573_c0_g1_i1.p1 TRINITY_DN7573_c0_g1~~TRINITY_DN7573_c0_g1_i1.p1  ORF type:complete len:522 (-),score=94.75 TRINITY_DN7573_c0_g1_i1:267-1832(-)
MGKFKGKTKRKKKVAQLDWFYDENELKEGILTVRILSAVNIPRYNGNKDDLISYCVLKIVQKRLITENKPGKNPRWDQELSLEMNPHELVYCELDIKVYHSVVGSDDFKLVGGNTIPLSETRDGISNFTKDCVYHLNYGNEAESDTHVHLQLRYNRYSILPEEDYIPLLDTLYSDDFCIIKILCKLNGNAEYKKILGECLYKAYEHRQETVQLIENLAKFEIENISESDKFDTFRQDSVVSKVIELLLEEYGSDYLYFTLSDWMKNVQDDDKIYNIFNTESSSYNTGIESLKYHIEELLVSIFDSIDYCPLIIRNVFERISELTLERFPEEEDLPLILVSSFLFLRFINPAIMCPTNTLVNTALSPETSQTFLYVVKCTQHLASLNEYYRGKEAYMAPLMEYVTEYRDKMIEFIKNISESSNNPTKFTPVLIENKFPGSYVARLYRQVSLSYDIIHDNLIQLEKTGLSNQLEFALKDLRELEQVSIVMSDVKKKNRKKYKKNKCVFLQCRSFIYMTNFLKS